MGWRISMNMGGEGVLCHILPFINLSCLWDNCTWKITHTIATGILCWTEWPHGPRQTMISHTRTLESWVHIPFEAWMSFRVLPVFVAASRQGWSLLQGVLPTVYNDPYFHINSDETRPARAFTAKRRRRVSCSPLSTRHHCLYNYGGPLEFAQNVRTYLNETFLESCVPNGKIWR
jgi:hypothetical protein